MKNLLILLALIFVTVPASAQNTFFRPFTSLRVIQTQYFDIIFPPASETSARTLAAYADDTYRHMSSLLGIELPRRIPVVITPYMDEFNGFFHSFNYIVLFDTPMDIEWTTFANSLEGLFIHELAHAVSLNSRNRFFNFLYRVFGSWASPTAFNVPAFMVEGVAITFESLDGFGRGNDPRSKQFLRQAAHENKFLTPLQASRLYDRPMQPGGYWYEFGAFFSLWLIENFGMEKYTELWRKLGQALPFSFAVYRSDFYAAFNVIYGINFLTAWNNFRISLLIDGLETNEDEIIPRRMRHFRERQNFIRTLTARGNNLYFIDRTDRKIGIHDTTTGKTRYINSGVAVYDIDVSPDGKTLLLSAYHYINDRSFAVVSEVMSHNGRSTGRRISGLYSARYFRDGVIGIRSNLHSTNIVYETFDGKQTILLEGGANFLFSGPQPFDNDRIVFITSRAGRRELWLYNFSTKELFRIEDENPYGKDYWKHMRNLSVTDGKLFFSHNADNRMFKAAYIDLENKRGVFNNRDFSGGVFNPVSINGTIYYRGAFVRRDRLLRFPERIGELSGEQINLRLVPLDKQSFETAGTIAEPPPIFADTPCKPYMAIRYMNPFRFWIPLPLIRSFNTNENLGLRVDGGGIFSLMIDPAFRNQIVLWAYADLRYNMAMVEQFSWTNSYMGFPITLNFSDMVLENASSLTSLTGNHNSGEGVFRFTNINIRGDLNVRTRRLGQAFSLGAGYTRRANFQEGSAYEWRKTNSGFNVSAGYLISFNRMSFTAAAVSFVHDFQPRIDGVITAGTNTRFPLRFNLFGAYDKGEMNMHGRSENYGNRLITNYALFEYTPQNLNLLHWIAGGEAAINLFSFHIQRNFSHIYFNRVFGTLALRNQIYDSKGHEDAQGIAINDNLRLAQSLMLRLGMRMSALPVVKQPVFFEPFVSGAWKFSNTITGQGSPWQIRLGLTASL